MIADAVTLDATGSFVRPAVPPLARARPELLSSSGAVSWTDTPAAPWASARGSLIGCGATEGGTVAESELGAVAGEPPVKPPSPAAAVDDPNAVYALGSGGGEKAPVCSVRPRSLRPRAPCRLMGWPLRSGVSAIDLACGPRCVIRAAGLAGGAGGAGRSGGPT